MGSSPKRERQNAKQKANENSRQENRNTAELTYRQLYAEAQRRNLKGRSMMRKADLARALA